jgi:hypothetical protein
MRARSRSIAEYEEHNLRLSRIRIRSLQVLESHAGMNAELVGNRLSVGV